ncbi:MAG: hypothetical protein ACOVSI_05475 [Gemmatimonas sp.]|jgi:hypothetical protein
MSEQTLRSPSGPGKQASEQPSEHRKTVSVSETHVELAQLAERLRQAVLNVVWQQWRILGAGTTTGRTRVVESDRHDHQHALVDPEALVLVSLTLLEEERRLGDVLHDWCVHNSDLLSVQRMKNLEADYQAPTRQSLAQPLAWFAAVATDKAKDHRWKSLAHTPKGADAEQAYGRQFGSHAPGGAKTKSRAVRARLKDPAALMLRLRLGLGVGIKSDLIAFLLARGGGWATTREMTEATKYTVAAVRRAAEDLAAARLIESVDDQATRYRVSVDQWGPLLGVHGRPSSWESWHERFLFTTAFLTWAADARQRPLTAYAFGANGRRLLENHRAAFGRDQLVLWNAHADVQDWDSVVDETVRQLASWMEEAV